jgi:hypothetical protein
MLRAVRAADIRQIIGKLVEMAKAGDILATGLLLAHLLGRPRETVRVEERQFVQFDWDAFCRDGQQDPDLIEEEILAVEGETHFSRLAVVQSPDTEALHPQIATPPLRVRTEPATHPPIVIARRAAHYGSSVGGRVGARSLLCAGCFVTEIVVRPVTCRREKSDFLSFPWALYRDDPNWVPPLRGDQAERVGFRPHPFYEHNEAQAFVAYRRGQFCGRVVAIVNRGHMERFAERRGYFGFFECAEDREAAGRLFDAARLWLAARDIRRLRGPVDPAMDYGIGILVEGFDSPPTFLTNYNPPYYARLVEGYGFRKVQDLYSYVFPMSRLAGIESKLKRIVSRLEGRHQLRLRRLDKRRYLQDVEEFLELNNRSLGEHWGYVPMTLAEVRHMARSMRPLVVPELALAVEIDGALRGAVLALPDYNPRIRAIDGRLFPFGFVRLLWRRKRIPRLRVVYASVVPEWQRAGVVLVLLAGLIPAALRWGIREFEFSWIAESNTLSRTTLERAGAVRTKTHRVYDLDT